MNIATIAASAAAMLAVSATASIGQSKYRGQQGNSTRAVRAAAKRRRQLRRRQLRRDGQRAAKGQPRRRSR